MGWLIPSGNLFVSLCSLMHLINAEFKVTFVSSRTKNVWFMFSIIVYRNSLNSFHSSKNLRRLSSWFYFNSKILLITMLLIKVNVSFLRVLSLFPIFRLAIFFRIVIVIGVHSFGLFYTSYERSLVLLIVTLVLNGFLRLRIQLRDC